MSRFHWISASLLPLSVVVSTAEAKDYLSVEQAQKLLFPEATAFADKAVTLSKDQKKQIKALSGLRQRTDVQKIWRVQKDQAFLGWFVVDDVIGKHEYITYCVALSPKGEVLGVEILSYRETHGKQVRNPEWRNHFKGKTLESALKLGMDIPNISGATLSCRNVTDGVKRLLALQKVALT